LLMMYSSAEYQYTSTGTLVTSASIADDEKQISDTVAKLATFRFSDDPVSERTLLIFENSIAPLNDHKK
jgi:hypothetical protein